MKKLKYLQSLNEYEATKMGTETVPTKTPIPTKQPTKRPSPSNPPQPAEKIEPKAWTEMLKKCVERYNELHRAGKTSLLKESIEKLPGYEKMKASLPKSDPMRHMQLTVEAYNLMMEIGELEKENFSDDELKQIATDIVRKIFEGTALVKKGVSFDDFKFDLEFVREPQEQEDMKKDIPLAPKKEKEEDESVKVEIDKRKLINALTQGFSIQSQARMFDEDVDEIVNQIDRELFNKYFEFMTKALEGHKYMDLEMFREIMFQFQKMQEEQPEDEEKITPPGMIVPSVMNVDNEGGQVTIHVKSVCLILMIHEMVKGIFEVISHFGFSGMELETLKKVKSKTESLYNEQEGFVYGPILVQIFKDFYFEVENHLIKRDVITEHDTTMMYSLLRDLYDPTITPSTKFIEIFEGIFNTELDQELWPIEEVAEMYKTIVETEVDSEETHATDAFRQDYYEQGDEEYGDYAGAETGEEPEEDEISRIIARSKEGENMPTLDELLDKIGEYGIESLSDEERMLLKKYSQNMSKITDFRKFEILLEVRKFL